MFELIVIGEALIDYTPAGKSADGHNLYEENPGGACANLACAAAKLGTNTGFIGKVGADTQGGLLAKSISNCGVDVSGMVYDPDQYTTLSFVSLTDAGERDFSFARKPGADTCLRKNEVQSRLWKNAKALHFGALALNANPTRDTTLEIVDKAKEQGTIICYDANYRDFLWEARSAYRGRSLLAIAKTDVLKISEEEAAIVTETDDLEKAANILLKSGPSIVCITLGEQGCFIKTKEGEVHSNALKVQKVVDTTGAGDCFFGAFLNQLLRLPKPLEASLVTLKDIARYGNAAAALCVGKRGGIPALPDAEAVEKLFMEGN